MTRPFFTTIWHWLIYAILSKFEIDLKVFTNSTFGTHAHSVRVRGKGCWDGAARVRGTPIRCVLGVGSTWGHTMCNF